LAAPAQTRYRTVSGLAKFVTVVFGIIGSAPAFIGGALIYRANGGSIGETVRQPTDVPLGLLLIVAGIALSAGAVALGAYYE
jgi:formate hydrogenlyase subunit 3/multisubunit Na+/H+ antiporter MnhD subunit